MVALPAAPPAHGRAAEWPFRCFISPALRPFLSIFLVGPAAPLCSPFSQVIAFVGRNNMSNPSENNYAVRNGAEKSARGAINSFLCRLRSGPSMIAALAAELVVTARRRRGSDPIAAAAQLILLLCGGFTLPPCGNLASSSQQ